jgi:MarR family transcriptional regulator for hemolysin
VATAAPTRAAAADLSDALRTFFRAARRARGRAARQPAGDGLSLAQYHALEPLLERPCSVREVAELSGVAPPTACRVIDGLVARGLVAREPDAGDRRALVLTLTPAGRRATLAKRRSFDGVRERITGTLDADEQRQAAELLRRLAEVIEEL